MSHSQYRTAIARYTWIDVNVSILYVHTNASHYTYIDAITHAHTQRPFVHTFTHETPQSPLTCIYFHWYVERISRPSHRQHWHYTHSNTLSADGWPVSVSVCVWMRTQTSSFMPKTKHYCRIERNFLSVKLNQHWVGHGRIVSDD